MFINYLPVEQYSSVNPGGHMQLYPFALSLQVAPFLQGPDAQVDIAKCFKEEYISRDIDTSSFQDAIYSK